MMKFFLLVLTVALPVLADPSSPGLAAEDLARQAVLQMGLAADVEKKVVGGVLEDLPDLLGTQSPDAARSVVLEVYNQERVLVELTGIFLEYFTPPQLAELAEKGLAFTSVEVEEAYNQAQRVLDEPATRERDRIRWLLQQGSDAEVQTFALFQELSDALNAYRDANGRLPDGLDALSRPDPFGSIYLDAAKVIEDGWNRPVQYQPEEGGYRLVSLGQDLDDSEDDLVLLRQYSLVEE